MQAVASYILKGPVQAVMAAAVPALLSISAPFLLKLILIYFTGIVVTLVSLRLGAQKGLMVLAAAILAVFVTAQLMQVDGQLRLDVWNSAYLWMVAWIAGISLRASGSLIMTLQLVTGIGVGTILFFYVAVSTPIKSALLVMEPMRQVLSQPGSGMSPGEISDLLLFMAAVLPGLVVTTTLIGVIISLLVARSWQARLFNPGGLQQEFRSLKLGSRAGVVSLLLLASLVFAEQLDDPYRLILVNSSFVIGLLFVVVGLGVAHGMAARREGSAIWLIGLYVGLVILGKIVAPLLMVLALTDIWIDYRQRFNKV